MKSFSIMKDVKNKSRNFKWSPECKIIIPHQAIGPKRDTVEIRSLLFPCVLFAGLF